MIIFAKICKSIVCKDFILQNVHPAHFSNFCIMKWNCNIRNTCEKPYRYGSILTKICGLWTGNVVNRCDLSHKGCRHQKHGCRCGQ